METHVMFDRDGPLTGPVYGELIYQVTRIGEHNAIRLRDALRKHAGPAVLKTEDDFAALARLVYELRNMRAQSLNPLADAMVKHKFKVAKIKPLTERERYPDFERPLASKKLPKGRRVVNGGVA